MNVGKQELEHSMSAPKIYIERTLALIKPDAIHKEEEIEDLILKSGFYIVQTLTDLFSHKKWDNSVAYGNKRKIHLLPEQCSDFYSDQYGKMFFPTLTAYMSSGPVVAFMLSRHNAISYWKELIGPSNSLKAKETHPNSLRALYGTDDLRNAVHGSNCFISAEREIGFMFPDAIIEPIPIGQAAKDYLNLFVNPILLSGLTELCKEKPADPYIWLAEWLFKYNSNGPNVDRRPLE